MLHHVLAVWFHNHGHGRCHPGQLDHALVCLPPVHSCPRGVAQCLAYNVRTHCQPLLDPNLTLYSLYYVDVTVAPRSAITGTPSTCARGDIVTLFDTNIVIEMLTPVHSRTVAAI